jgi:DNA-binding MarR family transcriptional regulator
MAQDKSAWLPPRDGSTLSWARYRSGDDAAAPGGKLATMSEATRASLAKNLQEADDPRVLVDELTAMISECFLVHGRLVNIFSTIKDSVDLTGTEALTLFAVINSGKPVTVPQIGRSLGHARQVIQRAANVLVGRGLLETRDNPAHKRAAFLVATEAGRKIKLGFDAAGRAVAETLAGGMDLATVLATHDGLRQLRRAVDRRNREAGQQEAGTS